jgi:hypothetical protein
MTPSRTFVTPPTGNERVAMIFSFFQSISVFCNDFAVVFAMKFQPFQGNGG